MINEVTTFIERQDNNIIYFDDEEACDDKRHTSFYHLKYDNIINVEAMCTQEELEDNESPVSDYEKVLTNKFIKHKKLNEI